MQVVRVSREFSVPGSAVWEVIATPGVHERCHPFVARNPYERWDGVGSRDTLYYHGGKVLYRTVHEWTEGVGFDLEVIDALGMRSANVRWRIEEQGEGRSSLTVALAPYVVRRVPGFAQAAVMRAAITRPVSDYLAHVLRGIDHYVSTGETVRRNQFGSHLWFSPWTPSLRS